jgi:ParB/RepB/Spo0J family partition protein
MLENLKGKKLTDWVGQVIEVPVHLIKPDPENLREEFDEEDLKDLGNNMQLLGQLDEITVFAVIDADGAWKGYFDLHDGERRWRAAKMVGLPTLRAKIIERPSKEELLYKKVARFLQTRSLLPERKVAALEKSFNELGIFHKPSVWESYREKLGGGPEWPQIVRVLQLKPKVRNLMDEGLINFTLAQSIGRLPPEKQEEAAKFVVAQKINGRFFSTQMVPYLLEHPDANLAQAFEHTRVGGWKQYMKTPYEHGQEPPLHEKLEEFLDACVKWERAWEVVVHTGLVHDITGHQNYEYRLKEAARRITERAQALANRIEQQQSKASVKRALTSG